MPKGFSQAEKSIIKDRLLQAGRNYLETIGLRKTTVEDLTTAAGISKGAFYSFFNSKEELFLEVLEQAEREMQASLMSLAYNPGLGPREFFKRMLENSFTIWEKNSMLHHFDRQDYEILLRKIPAERLQIHLRADEAFINKIFSKWEGDGIEFNLEPRKVSSLLKALFFVSLHKNEMGADDYKDTMEVLIDLVAKHLVKN